MSDTDDTELLAHIERTFGTAAGPPALEVVPDPPLLAVPDPRFDVVPPGWWQHEALPVIEAIDTWAELDQAEALIRAAADYIEALGASDVEYRKALRCVEARRGQLLGPARPVGRPPGNVPPVEHSEDVAPATASRWRQLAEHWEDVVLPHLVATEDRFEVTQTRCLAVIRGPAPASAPPDDVAVAHLRDAARWITAATAERARSGVADATAEARALDRVERALAEYRAAIG